VFWSLDHRSLKIEVSGVIFRGCSVIGLGVGVFDLMNFMIWVLRVLGFEKGVFQFLREFMNLVLIDAHCCWLCDFDASPMFLDA